MDVRLDNLQVVRGERTVLAIPRLLISGGRITAILGPNGAGKTTLLRTIAGLDRPASGTVSLGGAPIGLAPARGLVAYAFQRAVFVSGTVEANMMLGLRLRGVPGPDRRHRIEVVSAELGIAHLLRRDVRRLSGGEAQRVNLARALVLGARVVLLDEPLAGLDAPSRESLLQDLPATLRSDPGTTVVLVTHDRDEAARVADDVVLLIDGSVHSAGTIEEVFARPQDAESARFLGWTIVDFDDGPAGVAPGALMPGRGEVEFTMEVETVVPVGRRWEAVGRIGASPARVAGSGNPRPAPGDMLVSVHGEELVRFPVEGKVKIRNGA